MLRRVRKQLRISPMRGKGLWWKGFAKKYTYTLRHIILYLFSQGLVLSFFMKVPHSGK